MLLVRDARVKRNTYLLCVDRSSPCVFNLSAEVAAVAVLHNYAQVFFARGEKRVFVAHDVGMVQSPQQLHLTVMSATRLINLQQESPKNIYTDYAVTEELLRKTRE